MVELRPEELDWYVLTISGGKEIWTDEILRRLGYATFTPYRTKWRFKNRYHRAKGENQRRPYPTPIDFQTALDWVELGAGVELCAGAFREANQRMHARGASPPKSLKARDQDVRRAVEAAGATGGGFVPDDPDVWLSNGERAFATAVRKLPGRSADLTALVEDKTLSDGDRGRKAKAMLAEAGLPT
jgi:hypothetical protein